jgi:hypothetical protein
MKNNNIELFGLPNHLKDYSLAYMEYYATGEGGSVYAELLFKDKKPSIELFFEPFVEIIPCVVEKEYNGETYLGFNPVFKVRFYECFGMMWSVFEKCCIINNNVLDLKTEMHYNLS